MSLYKKYRPKKFEQIYGNRDTVERLHNMILQGSLPTALLFSGPTGVGKTTASRITAAMLEAEKGDYQEINAASYRGIDMVRELESKVGYMPMSGKHRVFVIDEAHKLTSDAQNAFLKLLEDSAPNHVKFILCTTEPGKLISTVKGRCSKFEFKPLTEDTLTKLLKEVADTEGHELEDKIYSQIYDSSEGLPRNALQILEQVLQSDAHRQMEVAKDADKRRKKSIDLCRALIGGDGSKKVRSILRDLEGEDPESVRRHVLGYAKSVLLGENTNGIKADQAAMIIDEFREPFYNVGFPGLVLAAYTVVRQTK